MTLSWHTHYQTSLYKCVADNRGELTTFGDILFNRFAINHEFFFRDQASQQWSSGITNDLSNIVLLRDLERSDPDYDKKKLSIKQKLQCYTPSGAFESKKKGNERLLHTNPILQLDFDNLDEYDIDEVRSAIFDLPYVGFAGKSPSGYGLFALVLIDEPDRLEAYAEHCFIVFQKYGLPIDTTKGRNHKDLRFVSYDSNMAVRDNPTPLRIKRFNTPKIAPKPKGKTISTHSNNGGLLRWAANQVLNANVGQRFETVRKVSYTMGGHGYGLEEIKDVINSSSQYAGIEAKYITHAVEGFQAGQNKPIACQ